MNFRQHHFDTKVTNLRTPLILVEPQALADMWDLTDLHSDEIGWLGSVRILTRSQFLIDEVFLVEQGANGGTTEISEDGIAKLAEELLTSRGDEGLEIINRIRFWGHSHVNMGLTPSHQDDTMLRKLAGDTGDYFISARTNKRGGMRFDLLREDGLLITDIPWQINAPIESRRGHWQEQIKERVKRIGPITYYSKQGTWVRDTPTQGAKGSAAAGKTNGGSASARGLPPIKNSGTTGATGGGKAASASLTDTDYNKPQLVCASEQYYIDFFGQRRPLKDIDDEELFAYGFCYFDEDSYMALPEDVDIEQEIVDEAEDAVWVLFGATVFEDDDPIDELYRLKILADEDKKEEST